MNKIFAGKIFADYRQFLIYDSGSDPGNLPDWTEGDNHYKGYMVNESTINFLASAGTYSYWLEFFLSKNKPSFNDADRVLAFNLNIASDKLTIYDISRSIDISVASGSYGVYILGYNLVWGSTEFLDNFFHELYQLSQEEQNAELERRAELEQYKIILVPGQVEQEGVVKGDQYLYSIDQDISYEYLFSLFDESVTTYRSEDIENYNDYARQGYFSTESQICIGASCEPYTPIVKVNLADGIPDFSDCQRALSFNLIVTSGSVSVVSSLGFQYLRMNIANGSYISYILVYNLGIEIPVELSDELSYEKIAQRTDLERYEIFLVSGRVESEGVIKGDRYLWDD